MIDSNNIEVMRENLKDLSVLQKRTSTLADWTANRVGIEPLPSGETLSSMVNKLTGEVGNIYRKRVAKVLTIPDGTQNVSSTEVDFTNDIPEDAKNITIKLLSAGGYPMPYISDNGSILTWMSTTRASGHYGTIRNKSSAWTNYTFYFDIEYTMED